MVCRILQIQKENTQAQGSAARIGCGVETAPVDAAIVGIIDDGAGLE